MINITQEDFDAFLSVVKIGEFQINCLKAVNMLVDASGPNVKGLIEDGLDKYIAMTQVYRSLNKLEDMKLLSSEIETEREKGQKGVNRRLYKLTTLGKQYLTVLTQMNGENDE